jgi:hypothetical protein
MVVQTDEESAVRVKQEDAGNSYLEFLDELEAEHTFVPLGADLPILHRQTQVQHSPESRHRHSMPGRGTATGRGGHAP